MKRPEPKIQLEVDGKAIRMNLFVRTIFVNTVLGMVRSLDEIGPEPRRIVLTIEPPPAK